MKNDKAQIAFGAIALTLAGAAVLNIAVNAVTGVASALAPEPVAVAAPAPVAAEPKVQPLAEDPAMAARMQGECDEAGLAGEQCRRYWEIRRQQTLDSINSRESYRDFLARVEQRKADLEYCAKNRTDWSCTDGQYAGQY
jgi:hypothetical protein